MSLSVISMMIKDFKRETVGQLISARFELNLILLRHRLPPTKSRLCRAEKSKASH